MIYNNSHSNEKSFILMKLTSEGTINSLICSSLSFPKPCTNIALNSSGNSPVELSYVNPIFTQFSPSFLTCPMWLKLGSENLGPDRRLNFREWTGVVESTGPTTNRDVAKIKWTEFFWRPLWTQWPGLLRCSNYGSGCEFLKFEIWFWREKSVWRMISTRKFKFDTIILCIFLRFLIQCFKISWSCEGFLKDLKFKSDVLAENSPSQKDLIPCWPYRYKIQVIALNCTKVPLPLRFGPYLRFPWIFCELSGRFLKVTGVNISQIVRTLGSSHHESGSVHPRLFVEFTVGESGFPWASRSSEYVSGSDFDRENSVEKRYRRFHLFQLVFVRYDIMVWRHDVRNFFEFSPVFPVRFSCVAREVSRAITQSYFYQWNSLNFLRKILELVAMSICYLC